MAICRCVQTDSFQARPVALHYTMTKHFRKLGQKGRDLLVKLRTNQTSDWGEATESILITVKPTAVLHLTCILHELFNELLITAIEDTLRNTKYIFSTATVNNIVLPFWTASY